MVIKDIGFKLNLRNPGTKICNSFREYSYLFEPLQFRNDSFRYIVLDLKQITQFSIIPVGPQMIPRGCIHELGMEAIYKITVKDFPAFILVDEKGNDFFEGLL